MKRLRWKACFYENPDENKLEQVNNNYGFKSDRTPPQNTHLNEFENAMYDMVKNMEFQGNRNNFQSKLKDDLKKVKTSGKIMVFGDKTTNMYEMSKEDYVKLINDNVTKTYLKTTLSTKTKINKETRTFAKKLKLEKKMEQYADKPAYVTLKDHKDNFKTKLPCRLINPAKSEIGIVSKIELEKLNKELVNKVKCNQWRNTHTVIDWFKSIPNKAKARFIKFDIVDFYPSITENLLNNALSYAQTLIRIDDDIIQLIKHARKSLLFTEGNIWMKKGENPLFVVTMGSNDGAELSEFVGIYLLGILSNIIDRKDNGLYRDDGLASIQDANGPNLDRLRKNIIAIFQN